MDNPFNSKLYLIETKATIDEKNSTEIILRNFEIFPILFINDNRNLDTSIILERIWDEEDYFSFGAYLPFGDIKKIMEHFKKYGLKSSYKNIDYEMFCGKFDLSLIEPILRGLIIEYLIQSFDQNDVLDKINLLKDYSLSEVDKRILKK